MQHSHPISAVTEIYTCKDMAVNTSVREKSMDQRQDLNSEMKIELLSFHCREDVVHKDYKDPWRPESLARTESAKHQHC